MSIRNDYLKQVVTEDQQKDKAFNMLREDFSIEMLLRFHEVKGVIEDIWNLVENKSKLSGRLASIAAKDPDEWSENNLKDMALICCILWNDTGKEPELEE